MSARALCGARHAAVDTEPPDPPAAAAAPRCSGGCREAPDLRTDRGRVCSALPSPLHRLAACEAHNMSTRTPLPTVNERDTENVSEPPVRNRNHSQNSGGVGLLFFSFFFCTQVGAGNGSAVWGRRRRRRKEGGCCRATGPMSSAPASLLPSDGNGHMETGIKAQFAAVCAQMTSTLRQCGRLT